MTIFLYIVILAVFILVSFLLIKKFKLLIEENGNIPKEFRPIIYILFITVMIMIGVLIYSNFVSGSHYNF